MMKKALLFECLKMDSIWFKKMCVISTWCAPGYSLAVMEQATGQYGLSASS